MQDAGFLHKPIPEAWLAQSVERLTLMLDIKRLRVRPPHRAYFLSLHYMKLIEVFVAHLYDIWVVIKRLIIYFLVGMGNCWHVWIELRNKCLRGKR